MSYSQWSNFNYYNVGNRVFYDQLAYQALQANVNVVPTTLAPNWLLIPDPTGADVNSINGITNNVVLTGTIGATDSTVFFSPSGQEIGVSTNLFIRMGSFSNPAVPSNGSVQINFGNFVNANYNVMVSNTSNGLFLFTVNNKTTSSFFVQWSSTGGVGSFPISFDWVLIAETF